MSSPQDFEASSREAQGAIVDDFVYVVVAAAERQDDTLDLCVAGGLQSPARRLWPFGEELGGGRFFDDRPGQGSDVGGGVPSTASRRGLRQGATTSAAGLFDDEDL